MRRRVLVGVLVVYAAVVALLVLGPQVVAKRSSTPPTVCTGALGHASTSDITVPAGSVCRVTASTVNGSVTIARDAYFEASGTTIFGNVRASSALTVFLHDGTSVTGSVVIDGAPQIFLYKTSVGGTVSIVRAIAPGFGHVQVCDTTAGQVEVRASGPDVLVGDPLGGCPGNYIKRDLVVVGNVANSELQVAGNSVSGALIVTDNTGEAPKHVVNNTVLGRVDLSGNTAPFDASLS
jgi:hypothetical protein